jgi:hypothetical protein
MSLPILKLPDWSVLVKTTLPPAVSIISFAGIATPPLDGVAVVISFPEPTYSNV